jgi:hypothetical protein
MGPRPVRGFEAPRRSTIAQTPPNRIVASVSHFASLSVFTSFLDKLGQPHKPKLDSSLAEREGTAAAPP